MVSVGISDVALYVPRAKMSLERLISARAVGDRKLGRLLQAAARTTGQTGFRYPEPWEDSVTMAAEAAVALLRANPELEPARVRYLAVGTETGVDLSKPVAAYVQGLLHAAGRPLPTACSTFQVQHACAGGTVALASVAALLAAAPQRRECGLVLCTDIARYEACGTAEITQGAGAAGLLVERDPRLVELDLGTIGLSSRDVDDFFRPVGVETARVKGGYSIHCYLQALEDAFEDHCARLGSRPADVLAGTDFFLLHAPFRSMPEIAMKRLLAKHLGLAEEAAREFLRERGLPAAVEPVARIGNMYSGSLYLTLAFLLADRVRRLGASIAGRSLLLASYGSGNTMLVLRGRVAAGAPEVVARWDLERLWGEADPESLTEYEQWLASPLPAREYEQRLSGWRERIPRGSFYLARIREDGYREYAVR